MRKRRFCTKEEIDEIWNFYREFRENSALNKLYTTKQHRTSNTFRHVCLVARESIRYALKKGLNVDYHSLIRGAFLHDLFYYDWRKDKKIARKHLILHPREAFDNAIKHFDLTPIEVDIIINHMWPITITKFPRTKEGKIVMLMDKKVTIKEVFTKKTNVIIFDLDGTLLDTLGDIQAAVNFALKKNGFPTVDKEKVRKSLGNGGSTLINRCLPVCVTKAMHKQVYDDFKNYYQQNPCTHTKPYDDINRVLKKLKRHGYTLIVATNKTKIVANQLINKFFPNFFNYVQTDDGTVELKPSGSMIGNIIKVCNIKKKKHVVYIGDTQTDYLTGHNAKVNTLLVTYGYRTQEELEEIKDKKILFINSPTGLLDYLGIAHAS